MSVRHRTILIIKELAAALGDENFFLMVKLYLCTLKYNVLTKINYGFQSILRNISLLGNIVFLFYFLLPAVYLSIICYFLMENIL